MSELIRSHGLGALTTLHETIGRTKGFTAVIFAVVLGSFSALAFAPFHVTPALIVSFVGLVWMIDGARGQKRWGRSVFLRGWAFGFGFFLVSMYWTALPFLVEPEKHAFFIWMPLIALPGGMALIWGAACALAGAFWSASPSRVFIFALFMGGAELVRGTLFGGFPWNIAGTSWAPGSALSQAAALGGVYWLTQVTLFFAASAAALVDTRNERGLLLRSMPALISVALVSGAWAWGAQRLANDVPMSERTVLLMDAGVPQAEKFNRANDVLARYVDLLRDVPSETSDIVIWPEGALPFDLLQSNEALDLISVFLNRRLLIAGSARQAAIEGQPQFFNSLTVFRSGGQTAQLVALYDKHRLVPFGELPATKIVPFGERISGILPSAVQRLATSGFTPGPEATVIVQDAFLPPFIPLICYEGLFPETVRKARPQREVAEWIVVISNDAWFGGGLGPQQHYAQNRYRAIESGLPMARVATRGITGMVDAYGREIARGSRFAGDPEGWRSSVVRAPLPARAPTTIYQRFGESLFWVTFVLLGGLAFLSWRR
ncbi:MAG: apolipoprotein N-acyltransferase [Pseudomonadota bacterium]